MARSNAFKMSLPSVDDLFSTEESRQESKLKKIYEIPISEIDDFPDHPYRVVDDEDMNNLMESIELRGIILREDEEEHCIDKIRELKNLLEKSPKAILWYDNDLFQKIVNRVYINSKKEIEFELLCGFRFKEKIIWN